MSLENLKKKLAKKSSRVARASADNLAVPRVNLAKTGKAARALNSLLDAISKDDLDEVVAVWRRAMQATRRIFDQECKVWIEEPDYRTQLEASKVVAAYVEGLPVQRQIIVSAKFEDMSETLARFQGAREPLMLPPNAEK